MGNTEGNISISTTDGVSTIEFFHPMSNSLPSTLLVKLEQSILSLSKDDDTRVIILKSSGERAFCAGASFDELLNIKDKDTGKEFFSGFARVINAMRKCPKFIIGRIHGKTVGGGVGLVSATDYSIATKFASIKLSELSIGIGPFVIGPVVKRKIGVSAFGNLSINATEWKTPEWALQNNLYSEVHNSSEEMDESIAILAEKLSKSNPEASSKMKKMFWEGTEHWDDLLIEQAAMSGELVLSDFTKQALEKFKK